MELRPLIKREPILEKGYNKYIILIMGLVGLLVGGVGRIVSWRILRR